MNDKLDRLRKVSEETGKNIFQLALEEEMVLIGDGRNWDDPVFMINQIISWHVMVALDPAVSEEARQLRDTYKPDDPISLDDTDDTACYEPSSWDQ